MNLRSEQELDIKLYLFIVISIFSAFWLEMIYLNTIVNKIHLFKIY